MAESFAIKDCALVAIATGKRSQNLRELLENLQEAHPGCIYFHFWGSLLRPKFDDPEYRNDFAAWAQHGLRDHKLAEQLGVIDPTDYQDIEDLRRELIEVIAERLDESEWVPWSKADQKFHFTRSQIVVFDTNTRVESAEDLRAIASNLSVSSIFYHFIDARRRSDSNTDDFSAWLTGLGETYGPTVDRLGEIDPYFFTLTELREQIENAFNETLR